MTAKDSLEEAVNLCMESFEGMTPKQRHVSMALLKTFRQAMEEREEELLVARAHETAGWSAYSVEVEARDRRAKLELSGGIKNPPPLLGPTKIKASGPKEDDVAFRIYVLFTGSAKTGAEADALLAEAKGEA